MLHFANNSHLRHYVAGITAEILFDDVQSVVQRLTDILITDNRHICNPAALRDVLRHCAQLLTHLKHHLLHRSQRTSWLPRDQNRLVSTNCPNATGSR